VLPQICLPLDEDPCPVGDEAMSAVYRAGAQERDEMIAGMSPTARAMLALYCYRRGHFQELGMKLAAECEKDELVRWGGAIVGAALFERAREPYDPQAGAPRHYGRRKITLASAAPGPRIVYEDIED